MIFDQVADPSRHTYQPNKGKAMGQENNQADFAKNMVSLIDANLMDSRVSAMYTEESIDEGRSLVDNLEGIGAEEDEGMKAIEQMRLLIDGCKIDLDQKPEVDEDKQQRMQALKTKLDQAEQIMRDQ